MDTEILQLKQEIKELKQRNQRVERDKAWETSWFRISLIAILTYLIIALFLFSLGANLPLVNALIPTIGFSLSIQSLPFIKKWWLKKYFR